MGSFQDACVAAGVPTNDLMRVIWRAVRFVDGIPVLRVMYALDPQGSQERVIYAALDANLKVAGGRAGLDVVLARSFQAVTSGRADADELRAAFALGGLVAVRDLLEAQGAAHARTDSP